MGSGVKASGSSSFSIGENSIAEGQTSIAMGFHASATGAFAKSIGNLTSATGNISIAMGTGTIAPSFAEFVIGRLNTEYTPLNTTNWNNADRLFVIGNGTDDANRSDAMVVMKNGAIGMGVSQPAAFSNLHLHNKNANLVFLRFTNTETGTSFTDGFRMGIRDDDHQAQILNFENGPITLGTNGTERVRTTADGNVGIGTNTPTALLHTNGTGTGEGNVLIIGSYKLSNPGSPPVSGFGTRMMWYPDKAAFRAGAVNGTHWDIGNIGITSNAWGYNSTASGESATSWGQNTIALGTNATSWGWSTTVPSYAETVFGRYNALYTPSSTTSWNATDRLFVIGNVTSSANRNNALTVLKNGKTAIGNVAPVTTLHVSHGTLGQNVPPTEGLRLHNSGANNNSWTLYTVNSTGNLQFYANNDLRGTFSATNGVFTSSSNRLLKTDITTLGEDILKRTMLLQPVSYRFKSNPTHQPTLGFIAEDVLPIFPEL